MTETSRVIVVGCGHMGLAIVRGLLSSMPASRLCVVEQSEQRRAALAPLYAFSIGSELRIADEDLVVLAIPPQAFGDFSSTARREFDRHTPVLSVMAGIVAGSISDALGTSEVVRAIPNTPSEIFEGMSVYYADPTVSPGTLLRAKKLLQAIGRTIQVDAEHLVDDATAICGGGPAFVSYIADAFCSFAVSRGFTSAAGREMAAQVFAGTAKLMAHTGKSPMQLCREVMTPNGTTERGISVFEAAGLKASIVAGLSASALRSRELAHAAPAYAAG